MRIFVIVLTAGWLAKGDFVEISSHLTNTGIGAIAVVGLGVLRWYADRLR